MDIRLVTAKEYYELCEEIEAHSFRYHMMNAPIIRDTQYDSLKQTLRAIESERPEWVTFKSPTRRVGGWLLTEPVPLLCRH